MGIAQNLHIISSNTKKILLHSPTLREELHIECHFIVALSSDLNVFICSLRDAIAHF